LPATATTVIPGGTAPPPKTTPPPVAVACDLFDVGALNAATGHTWTGRPKADQKGCALIAENNNSVNVSVQAHPGQSQATFESSQQRCDAGTLETVSAGDGAYVCLVEGRAVGAILVAPKDAVALLDAGAFGSTPAGDIKNTLRAVAQSYVAPH
jgi:hypothetical protein